VQTWVVRLPQLHLDLRQQPLGLCLVRVLQLQLLELRVLHRLEPAQAHPRARLRSASDPRLELELREEQEQQEVEQGWGRVELRLFSGRETRHQAVGICLGTQAKV